jgi:hypothetical protein
MLTVNPAIAGIFTSITPRAIPSKSFLINLSSCLSTKHVRGSERVVIWATKNECWAGKFLGKTAYPISSHYFRISLERPRMTLSIDIVTKGECKSRELRLHQPAGIVLINVVFEGNIQFLTTFSGPLFCLKLCLLLMEVSIDSVSEV